MTMADSSDPRLFNKPKRLISLDAYRGFVMLAMASSGLGFARAVQKYPEIKTQLEGTSLDTAWHGMWDTLVYQFSHAPWTGCSFWDLIQPSFMFMVGVAMPFSKASRESLGHSPPKMFLHSVWRAAVLVLLAVFLSSNWGKQTNFTFTNVLAQIGLGYVFVYLLVGRGFVLQLLAAIAILGGSWYYFYQYEIPADEQAQLTQYLSEEKGQAKEKWTQFPDGMAAHWNQHTNAAAAFDRRFLNKFPRSEEPFEGQRFWANSGGYATLNFIPSMATMLFGLMAGTMLRGPGQPMHKCRNLLLAGLVCFVTAMAVDTTIWPVQFESLNWSLCPVVKRIWSPTWAVFSTGWTLWMLAAFYWVIDIQGLKKWAFPLVVVGMNSIAIYCMAQLMKPWIGKIMEIHANAMSILVGGYDGDFDLWRLLVENNIYGPIWLSVLQVLVLWLICLWLYRRKIFVRI